MAETSGTRIEFWGGLNVIGGSKIMISTERARVLLDFGLDIPSGADLFRPPVRLRPGRELGDYLMSGQAPPVPGVYAPDLLVGHGARARTLAPLAEPDPRPTAIFLSHAHIDHDGLMGFVRDDLDCYAYPDTVAVHRALRTAGLGPSGHAVGLQPITEPVSVGDLTVTAVPVSHDVPGACGYLVEAADGRVAYTGDINFHRDGGAASTAFVERVRGVDALVTETTTLSFDPPADAEPYRPLTEDDVIDRFAAACDRPDLVLLAAYERDIDRAGRLIEAARGVGRTLVWPGRQAAFLQAYGLPGVVTWDASRPQRPVHADAVTAVAGEHGTVSTVGLDEVHARPGAYVVQLDPDDNPALLDLPIGDGTVWVHSQGEPLGPYMATWQPFMDWLDALGIETVHAGSSGHAPGEDLIAMVEQIGPGVVYPIHGFHPERLVTSRPTVLPVAGRSYPLRPTG